MRNRTEREPHLGNTGGKLIYLILGIAVGTMILIAVVAGISFATS